MSKYFKQKFAREGYFKIEGVVDKKEIINLSKDIKNSTYKEINNGKHLCSIECADDVNLAIKNFIDTNDEA